MQKSTEVVTNFCHKLIWQEMDKKKIVFTPNKVICHICCAKHEESCCCVQNVCMDTTYVWVLLVEKVEEVL